MKKVCDKYGALLILDGQYLLIRFEPLFKITDHEQRSCAGWVVVDHFMSGSKRASSQIFRPLPKV
jgi:hypothetical protein